VKNASKVIATSCCLALGAVTCLIPPAKTQLLNEYNKQQQDAQESERRLRRNIDIVCREGQFVGPHFGFSELRDVYLIDKNNKIFLYTDVTKSGERYRGRDGYDFYTSKLTCYPSSGWKTSTGFHYLGNLGAANRCEENGAYCQYSIEDVGLYEYKKYDGSAEVLKRLVATRISRIRINGGPDLRRCDGYQQGPNEAAACFGK